MPPPSNIKFSDMSIIMNHMKTQSNGTEQNNPLQSLIRLKIPPSKPLALKLSTVSNLPAEFVFFHKNGTEFGRIVLIYLYPENVKKKIIETNCAFNYHLNPNLLNPNLIAQ